MTAIDPPSTRSPCPSWCERRHGAADVDPDGHRGLQWSPALADDGYWVDIPTLQNMDGDVVVQVASLKC